MNAGSMNARPPNGRRRIFPARQPQSLQTYALYAPVPPMTSARDFERQHGELLDGQTQQFSALSKQRPGKRDSFAANREEAIRHHAGRVQGRSTDAKSKPLSNSKKTNSVAGRLSAFTEKGRDRRAGGGRGFLLKTLKTEGLARRRDLAARQDGGGERTESPPAPRHGIEGHARGPCCRPRQATRLAGR